jgi:hypothetical protein
MKTKQEKEYSFFEDMAFDMQQQMYEALMVDPIHFGRGDRPVGIRQSSEEMMHMQRIGRVTRPERNERKGKDTSFKICAPASDMKTDGMELKDGYKLIPDPIVLFPCRNQIYCIVSKWGIEGEDSALVNEKSN